MNGTGPGLTGSDIVEAYERGDRRFITIDSTESYGEAAHRVRRLIAMIGDRAVVVLDDIEPPGRPVTAQYQAAHEAEVLGDGHAVIRGKKRALGLWTFGHEPALRIVRREFGRGFGFNDWHDYDWHSVTGRYIADADVPLVTVLVPSRTDSLRAPSYSADDGLITVTLSDGAVVRFEHAADGWSHAD